MNFAAYDDICDLAASCCPVDSAIMSITATKDGCLHFVWAWSEGRYSHRMDLEALDQSWAGPVRHANHELRQCHLRMLNMRSFG